MVLSFAAISEFVMLAEIVFVNVIELILSYVLAPFGLPQLDTVYLLLVLKNREDGVQLPQSHI